MSNDGELIIPKNKVRVYDYIKNHPGSHLRKISKELAMTTSDTQYWCNRLEKMALVRSRRLGLYKTYYPASILGERHEHILAILQQKTPSIIVLYLIENSGASQKDIAQHTGFAAATISWHMSRLIEFGIVYNIKKGKFVKYYIRGDIADLVILLKSYHPSIWDKLSDRLSELFLGITYATTSEIRGEHTHEKETTSSNTPTSTNTNINEKIDTNTNINEKQEENGGTDID
jgi:DNA-binding MarR family transcriptional regulator